jgi:hypothetical protein
LRFENATAKYRHFQQKWAPVLRSENATAWDPAFSAKVGTGFAGKSR